MPSEGGRVHVQIACSLEKRMNRRDIEDDWKNGLKCMSQFKELGVSVWVVGVV